MPGFRDRVKAAAPEAGGKPSLKDRVLGSQSQKPFRERVLEASSPEPADFDDILTLGQRLGNLPDGTPSAIERINKVAPHSNLSLNSHLRKPFPGMAKEAQELGVDERDLDLVFGERDVSGRSLRYRSDVIEAMEELLGKSPTKERVRHANAALTIGRLKQLRSRDHLDEGGLAAFARVLEGVASDEDRTKADEIIKFAEGKAASLDRANTAKLESREHGFVGTTVGNIAASVGLTPDRVREGVANIFGAVGAKDLAKEISRTGLTDQELARAYQRMGTAEKLGSSLIQFTAAMKVLQPVAEGYTAMFLKGAEKSHTIARLAPTREWAMKNFGLPMAMASMGAANQGPEGAITGFLGGRLAPPLENWLIKSMPHLPKRMQAAIADSLSDTVRQAGLQGELITFDDLLASMVHGGIRGVATPQDDFAQGRAEKPGGVVQMHSGPDLSPLSVDALPLAREAINFGKRTFGTMVTRIASHKGGTRIAKMADDTVDSQKAFAGAVEPEHVAALEAAEFSRHGLGEPQRVKGQDYGVVPLHNEGDRSGLSAKARNIMEKVDALVFARGKKIFEAAGVQQLKPDGTFAPFRATPGTIRPQVYGRELFSIFRNGTDDSRWPKLVDAFAHFNNIPKTEAETVLGDLSKGMDDDSVGSIEKTAQAELSRKYRMPHALYVDSAVPGKKPTIVPLVETDAVRYINGLVRRGSARAAVIKHWGQDTGSGNEITRLAADFKRRNNTLTPFAETMRALHETPVDMSVMGKTNATARLIHGVENTMRGVRAAVLSKSVVVNIPEALGNVGDFGGTGTLVKERMGTLLRSSNAKSLQKDAESLGAVLPDIMNVGYDPARRGESVSRLFAEASGKILLHRQMNQAQENAGAKVALLMMQKAQRGEFVKDGKLTIEGSKMVSRIQSIGHTSFARALKLVRGKGTQSEYDRIVRKAPARFGGANMAAAERSRLQHARLFTLSVPFSGYASAVLRDGAAKTGTWMNTMDKAIKSNNLSKGEKWKLIYAANRQYGRFIAGKAVQGSLAKFLGEVAIGGISGAEGVIEDVDAAGEAVSALMSGDFSGATEKLMDENLHAFVKESLFNSLFIGPYQQVLGEDITMESIFPVKTFLDMKNAYTGEGKFQGMDKTERFNALLDRYLPVKRVAETVAASVFGGEHEDTALRIKTARRRMFRWLEREGVLDKFETKDHDEEYEKFLGHMRRATKSALLQSPEESRAEYVKAIKIRGADSARSSITWRMALPRLKRAKLSDERIKAFKDYMGRGYDDLVLHDRLLQGLGHR